MREAYTASFHMMMDDQEGILRIGIKEDAAIGLEEIKKYYELTNILAGTQRVRVLIMAEQPFEISSEAREYISQQSFNRIATAIVTSNMAVRLIVNLYMKLINSASPIRLFSAEQKALEWLNSFQPIV
jgi:hypothetical protein